MTPAETRGTTYALTLPAIQKAVIELQGRYIHETFVVYLYVTRQGGRLASPGEHKRTAGITGNWSGEVQRWLDVPGGPPTKPNFRPFASRGSDPNRFWMAENLAGSYALSSIRSMRGLFAGADGKTYGLPHTEAGTIDTSPLVRSLLKGVPVPAWAVACFLYRNLSFTSSTNPQGADLLETFKDDFALTSEEQENLFEWSLPKIEFFETIEGED